MKPSKTTFSFVALACALAFAFGCVSPVKENWGKSVRDNKTAMIANPEAGTDEPVTELDPVTGKLVVENYEKNQRDSHEKERRELFLIAE